MRQLKMQISTQKDEEKKMLQPMKTVAQTFYGK